MIHLQVKDNIKKVIKTFNAVEKGNSDDKYNPTDRNRHSNISPSAADIW